MKRKVAWLVVSCLMVAALLLASCAPAVVEEKKVTPPVAKEVAPPVKEKEMVVPGKEVVPEGFVKWRGVKLDGTVVEKMIEKPKYGGTHISALPDPPAFFDEVVRSVSGGWASAPANEHLLAREWIRGNGGTEEWSGLMAGPPWPGWTEFILADSWELPEPDTLVYRIRQGVRWQDKPPMNGRELTAEDVLFILRRHWKEGYGKTAYPQLRDMNNVDESVYMSPTDKRAIVLKSAPGMVAVVWETSISHIRIHPPEVIKRDGFVKDWKNVVGTGPFILTDYVSGSSLSYVRNPNYWMRDPFFPENQLPYLDGYRCLIIKDLSTQMAALRTGKIDRLKDITAEDKTSLVKTNPELKWGQYIFSNTMISMRIDTKPFDDIRVRRALNMAVNQKEICDVYYGGNANLFAYPVNVAPGFMDMYTPLEEMPESVRELYEYHPDKARKLLAEAGYPNGFKTNVMCDIKDVDLFSIVKQDWAKIGVDLAIDVKESTVLTKITASKTHTQMVTTGFSWTGAWKMCYERPGSVNNMSMIVDPRIEEICQAINEVFFDRAKFAQAIKDTAAYRNEQSWYIYLPSPHVFVLWHPWLKGHYGIIATSYAQVTEYIRYAWIDRELKKAMGR